MQLDFFYHNRTPSYASMSTISGHAFLHPFMSNRSYVTADCSAEWGKALKSALFAISHLSSVMDVCPLISMVQSSGIYSSYEDNCLWSHCHCNMHAWS